MEEIKHINQAEATTWSYDVTDGFVMQTLTAIYYATNEIEKRGIEPIHPFDMLFFYVVTVRSFAERFRHTIIDPIPTPAPINGVNYLQLEDAKIKDSAFLRSGLASTFFETVRRESSPDGNPFDVQYASAILRCMIDEKVMPGQQERTLFLLKQAVGTIHKSMKQILDDDELWKYGRPGFVPKPIRKNDEQP
jgi:hypothetical protein